MQAQQWPASVEKDPDWVKGYQDGILEGRLTLYPVLPMQRGHSYLAGWLSGRFTSQPGNLVTPNSASSIEPAETSSSTAPSAKPKPPPSIPKWFE